MTSFPPKATLPLDSWVEEKQSVYLYKIIAECSSDAAQKKLFKALAEAAESQANLWKTEIEKLQGTVPEKYRPSFRVCLTGWLIRRLGPKSIRTILSAMKVRGMSVYSNDQPGHPMPKNIEDIGRMHKTSGSGNNLRAAVFGVNDGLVSNASLLMGMVAASASSETLILAGTAGLFAGAFSMAAGEFISVRSQREMFEYQIDLERKELELYPAEEKAELSIIYHARGLSKEEADRVAGIMMENPVNALDTLAREELGINPDDLVSPYGAAIFSFLSFVVGAAIPLFPFLFMTHQLTILVSTIVSGLSLFIVGCILSLFTGRSAFKSGLRMLFIGASASGLTYLIGSIVGVTLA